MHKRSSLLGAVAALALTALSTGALAAPPTRAGSASINGKDCAANFLFDTGASQTFISRDCATKLGLLDKDGKAVGNNGEKKFNGGDIDTWCFNNVNVGAKDDSTPSNNCVSSQTVYVTKKAGDAADDNVLGRPWQEDVDAVYRSKGQKLTWMSPAPVPPAKKDAKTKPDTKTGEIKSFFEGITLTGANGNAMLDMVYFAGSQYSIIPQSIASQIGTDAGMIDLQTADPALYRQLQTASLDSTLQSVFHLVTISDYDLGFGHVSGSMNFLVSNASNSDFGVFGDNLLTPQDLVYDANTGGQASLYQFAAVPEASTLVSVGALLCLGGLSYARMWRSRKVA